MKHLIILSLLLLFSCQESNSSSELNSNKNLVQYADFFQLIQQDGQTILQILSPETKKIEQTIVINPKDPLLKVACLSATHVGMMQKLNLIDRIGAVSNSLYIYNSELLKNVQDKKVLELGEEMQIPVESLVKSGCQAIFYSGFGKEFQHAKTLNKIGIDCLVNYDWRESHPLGKAEWILVFGYLMGKPAEAHAIFEDLKEKYLDLQVVSTNRKAKVISGNMWGDQWNAPAGESYQATLMKDAGAEYVYRKTKGTGSVQLSFEKIIADSKNVEFWLNTGIPTKKMMVASNPKLQNMSVFKTGKIYDYSRSGNRFWEMSAIEPHKVLEDYIRIFSGKNIEKLHFYHLVE
ncbi:MAG: ABC transporter substrate-binding protein [Bacteroidetes bacterium]|nr:ABC transporter substrate-binding protein [Bacteroidota bacterium]